MKLPQRDWVSFGYAVGKVAEWCLCTEDDAEEALKGAVVDRKVRWRRHRGPLDIPGAFQLDQLVYGYADDTRRVEVSRADVRAWLAEAKGPEWESWPEQTAAATAEPEVLTPGMPRLLPPKRLGGRPAKYDWEGALIAVVKLANTPDGLPTIQQDLVRWIQHWFLNTSGEEPAESEIKKRTRRIYARDENLPERVFRRDR